MKKKRRFLIVLIFFLHTFFILPESLNAQQEWKTYNTGNSGLQSNYFTALAVSNSGIKWLGTGGPQGGGEGLYKYDGKTWVLYNVGNTGLPNVAIFALLPDEEGGVWIGTAGGNSGTGGGLFYLKDNVLANYKQANSGLPDNDIYDIIFDKDKNLWIATKGGLAKFDGENWTVYNTSNSILPHDDVYNIVIDDDDVAWPCTGDHLPASEGGLVRIENGTLTVFDAGNSSLPYNFVFTIAIDNHGNKWLGALNNDEPGGLVVYQEGGLILDDGHYIRSDAPGRVTLFQNHPNPFTNITTIEYVLRNSGYVKLAVFDITGQIMKTPVSGYQQAGSYSIEWEGSGFAEGIYYYKLDSGGESSVRKMILRK